MSDGAMNNRLQSDSSRTMSPEEKMPDGAVESPSSSQINRRAISDFLQTDPLLGDSMARVGVLRMPNVGACNSLTLWRVQFAATGVPERILQDWALSLSWSRTGEKGPGSLIA